MKDIITNLKFLSNLEKQDKINTKYMFKEQAGILTSVKRTFFYNDNRKNTLKFIQTTISNGFELLSYYERLDKLSDKAMCVNIVQDLLQSKTGLENLKDTYSMDLQFVCNIDTILQNIDARMKDVETKYDIKPPSTQSIESLNNNKLVDVRATESIQTEITKNESSEEEETFISQTSTPFFDGKYGLARIFRSYDDNPTGEQSAIIPILSLDANKSSNEETKNNVDERSPLASKKNKHNHQSKNKS